MEDDGEGGGLRLSKRFAGGKLGGGEVDYKTNAATAWNHSYLNQKPWHPLSYPNQRRKWIAEQNHAQRERRAEEVAYEFAQEQEFFRQTALLSDKEKEKSILFGHIFDQMLQQLESPVEFQLPDWLMKPKRMPYTFIKRNVYLTKRIKTRAEDDGIFCSCSPSAGTSVVCDRDCLCGILLSSCSQSCKCGNLCLNKPFQNRPVKKMKLVQTEKCGSGIIADEDIKLGEFVIEYVGEVIDDKTCEDRLWQMKHRGEKNFYLCEINRDMVIDATFKGNKSRYINHSCQPNTEMQKWIIDGETRIGIFATRDIKKGEDLTYDYQFVQFGADQDCYCGAIGCRRKLGNKPSKLKSSSSDAVLQLVQLGALLYGKDGLVSEGPELGNSHISSSHRIHGPFVNCINRVIKVWCSRNRRYFGGVILDFDSEAKKHIIMKENGEFETLDLSLEDWDLLDELP